MHTLASEDDVRSFARTLNDEALRAARLFDGIVEDFEELSTALSALYPDDEDAFDRVLKECEHAQVLKVLAFVATRATRALDGNRFAEPVESLSQLFGE